VSEFIKRRVKRVLHLSKRSTLPPSKLCKAEIQLIKRRATPQADAEPHLHQDNYHNPHAATHNPHKTNTKHTTAKPQNNNKKHLKTHKNQTQKPPNISNRELKVVCGVQRWQGFDRRHLK
jgi:hypothetical protein